MSEPKINYMLMLLDPNISSRVKLEAMNGLLDKVDTQKELDDIYPEMIIGALTNPDQLSDYAQLFRAYTRVINSGSPE